MFIYAFAGSAAFPSELAVLLLVNPDTYVRKLRKHFKCVWKDIAVAYYCKILKSMTQYNEFFLICVKCFSYHFTRGDSGRGRDSNYFVILMGFLFGSVSLLSLLLKSPFLNSFSFSYLFSESLA